jgi:hypothetical protein
VTESSDQRKLPEAENEAVRRSSESPRPGPFGHALKPGNLRVLVHTNIALLGLRTQPGFRTRRHGDSARCLKPRRMARAVSSGASTEQFSACDRCLAHSSARDDQPDALKFTLRLDQTSDTSAHGVRRGPACLIDMSQRRDAQAHDPADSRPARQD